MMNWKSILVCLCLMIEGCGFHPLYANKDVVLEKTASVQIQPIAGEGGYQMELVLQNRLNPTHKNVPPKYRLNVALKQPQYINQSIRSDNFASLETMNIQASYQLLNLENNSVLITSSVDSNGLFNLIKDPYATVVGQNKLYDNLILLIADDIATHILAYFEGIEQ